MSNSKTPINKNSRPPPKQLKSFAYIFVGGGIGACCRYALVLLLDTWHSPLLPIATLTANILGCAFIGAASVLIGSTDPGGPPSALWLGLVVGVLGGFTTFSTFTMEWSRMLENGHLIHAFFYTSGSILSCGLGFAAGIRITKFFLT